MHPLVLGIAKPLYGFLSIGKIIIAVAKICGIISKPVQKVERGGGVPSFAFHTMPAALAILALAQCKKLERFNSHRRHLCEMYARELEDTNYSHYEQTETNTPMLRFTIIAPHARKLILLARKQGIELGNWYTTPLAPEGSNYAALNYTLGSCKQAEAYARTTLNLPTHIGISDKDALRIVDFLKKN